MGNVCPWCGKHIDLMHKVWMKHNGPMYHFHCGTQAQQAEKNPHVTFQGNSYIEVARGRWRHVETS